MHALLHHSQIYVHSDSTQLQSLVAAAVAFQLVIVRVIVATAWLSNIKRWWLWWWQWMFTQQWCGPRYDAFRGICLKRRWSYNSKREEASLVYKMLITTKGMLSTTVKRLKICCYVSWDYLKGEGVVAWVCVFISRRFYAWLLSYPEYFVKTSRCLRLLY